MIGIILLAFLTLSGGQNGEMAKQEADLNNNGMPEDYILCRQQITIHEKGKIPLAVSVNLAGGTNSYRRCNQRRPSGNWFSFCGNKAVTGHRSPSGQMRKIRFGAIIFLSTLWRESR